jgi:hypothetical protein
MYCQEKRERRICFCQFNTIWILRKEFDQREMRLRKAANQAECTGRDRTQEFLSLFDTPLNSQQRL